MQKKTHEIQKFIRRHVNRHPNDIVKFTLEHFETSRTTVLRHMQHLIKQGIVVSSGKTKQVIYGLASAAQKNFVINLNDRFEEFEFFNEFLQAFLTKNLNHNAYEICEYAISEMLNNCKDHSRGKTVDIDIKIEHTKLICSITDNGVGVLHTLENVLSLSNPQDIIFELSKGKLTRDPSNHTGEGIFFTSRAVDSFVLRTNGYEYFRDNIEHDWTFHAIEKKTGTTILFEINKNTDRKLTQIFSQYTDNDYQFTSTEILVDLAKQYGERLISRSQAKRIVRNLEKFTKVTLDFKNVQAIGQGFVDQLFRVHQNQRPEIELIYVNANPDVSFMIIRGLTPNLSSIEKTH